MLGWEFPPYFAGGVGVVCEALTRSLVGRGHEITYLMPWTPPASGGAGLELIGPGAGPHGLDVVGIPARLHSLRQRRPAEHPHPRGGAPRRPPCLYTGRTCSVRSSASRRAPWRWQKPAAPLRI